VPYTAAEADRLRGEARAPLDAAGPIAADYRSTHASMRAGSDCTRAMEEVVAQARLLRADGSTITARSTPGPDHKVDCPHYGFPRQPRDVGGPQLAAMRQLRVSG
jgi:hypothetical protein